MMVWRVNAFLHAVERHGARLIVGSLSLGGFVLLGCVALGLLAWLVAPGWGPELP